MKEYTRGNERRGKNSSRREGLREKTWESIRAMLDTRRDTMDAEIRKTSRVKIMAKEQTGSDLGEARSDTVRDKRAEKRWPGAGMMPERIMKRSLEEKNTLDYITTRTPDTREERRATSDGRSAQRQASNATRQQRGTRSDKRQPKYEKLEATSEHRYERQVWEKPEWASIRVKREEGK